jgi:hypothetical protein
LIDRLADEQVRDLLEDLRDPADTDGPPRDEETLASLDRGLAGIAADQTISLEDFDREPPIYEWQIRKLERREANLIANQESLTDWETVKRQVRELNPSRNA